MTYNYRFASSYMKRSTRDDETEPLEQSGRDTPTKSPISAETQQFEKEKSDSDLSNYLFVYFTQRKDKSDKV